jgi:hypothetical protein
MILFQLRLNQSQRLKNIFLPWGADIAQSRQRSFVETPACK